MKPIFPLTETGRRVGGCKVIHNTTINHCRVKPKVETMNIKKVSFLCPSHFHFILYYLITLSHITHTFHMSCILSCNARNDIKAETLIILYWPSFCALVGMGVGDCCFIVDGLAPCSLRRFAHVGCLEVLGLRPTSG